MGDSLKLSPGSLLRFPLFHPCFALFHPCFAPSLRRRAMRVEKGNEGGKGYGEAEGIKKVCSIGVLSERLTNKIYALITNSLSWELQ